MKNITSTPKTGNPIIDSLGEMSLLGNIIPFEWFQNPIFYLKSGTRVKGEGTQERKREETIYLLALVVLADIVYWYRPTVERDEDSGHVIGYRKRFTGDILEWVYEKRAARFGCTERQLKDCMAFLEAAGLITRFVKRPDNTVFVAPIPQKIWEITHGKSPEKAQEKSGSRLNGSRPPSKREPEHAQTEAGTRSNGGRGTLKRERNKDKNQPQKNRSLELIESDEENKFSLGEVEGDYDLEALTQMLIEARLKPSAAQYFARTVGKDIVTILKWWRAQRLDLIEKPQGLLVRALEDPKKYLSRVPSRQIEPAKIAHGSGGAYDAFSPSTPGDQGYESENDEDGNQDELLIEPMYALHIPTLVERIKSGHAVDRLDELRSEIAPFYELTHWEKLKALALAELDQGQDG